VPTPNELRQLADDVIERARAKAAELRRLADEMEAALEGLPNPTIGHTMDNMDTSTVPKAPSNRKGVKLTPEEDGDPRPYAIAALNAGLTLRELGEQLNLSYSAIKMRNARRFGDAETRKALAKKPYNVPASAWPGE